MSEKESEYLRGESRLEKFMDKEGWVKWERINHGMFYYFWRKEGFEIDSNEIEDLWGEKKC